jgi:hypothetical protein
VTFETKGELGGQVGRLGNRPAIDYELINHVQPQRGIMAGASG